MENKSELDIINKKKEKLRENQKRYSQKHKEEIKIRRKQRHLLNIEKEREYTKKYQKSHKLERKLYRLKNKEKIKIKNKEYRKKNKEHRLLYREAIKAICHWI